MTTVKAFNEMMGQFLDELAQTFPEEEAIKVAKETPRTRSTFEKFMKYVSPWSAQLMAKDDAFFCEDNKFAKQLNLQSIWTTEAATEGTKGAIWQYLQTMFILGNTINMFPPETLSMIETAAEACAKNMQAKGASGQAMNEQDLMAGMNSMLAQLMGGGGLPGLGAPALKPKPKKKH